MKLVTVATAKDGRFVERMNGAAVIQSGTRFVDWHQHMLASAQYARWLRHSTFSFVSGRDLG